MTDLNLFFVVSQEGVKVGVEERDLLLRSLTRTNYTVLKRDRNKGGGPRTSGGSLVPAPALRRACACLPSSVEGRVSSVPSTKKCLIQN